MPYLKVRPLSEPEKARGLFLKSNIPSISGVFVGWVRVRLPGPGFVMKCWVLDSGSLLDVPHDVNADFSDYSDGKGEVKVGVCTSDSKDPWIEVKHFRMTLGSKVQQPHVRSNMRAFYIGAEPLREYFETSGTPWSVSTAVLNTDLILVKKDKYRKQDCTF